MTSGGVIRLLIVDFPDQITSLLYKHANSYGWN